MSLARTVIVSILLGGAGIALAAGGPVTELGYTGASIGLLGGALVGAALALLMSELGGGGRATRASRRGGQPLRSAGRDEGRVGTGIFGRWAATDIDSRSSHSAHRRRGPSALRGRLPEGDAPAGTSPGGDRQERAFRERWPGTSWRPRASTRPA